MKNNFFSIVALMFLFLPVSGITPLPLYADAPMPDILPANSNDWIDTEIYVKSFTYLIIAAYGQACSAYENDVCVEPPWVGPEGKDDPYEPCDDPGCPIISAPSMALVGKIGEDGEPFLVGRRFADFTSEPGNLFLRCNDHNPIDNGGYFEFTTMRNYLDYWTPAATMTSTFWRRKWLN